MNKKIMLFTIFLVFLVTVCYSQDLQDLNKDDTINVFDLIISLNTNLLRGDVNDDYAVDVFDLVTVGLAFGSKPGDYNWNPDADLSNDWDRIDIFDLATVGVNFGRSLFEMSDSSNTSYVVVELNYTEAIVGDNLTINIDINTTDSVWAVSSALYFNSSIINATSVTEGDFLKQGGAQTFSVITIDNTLGKITYDSTRFFADPAQRSGATGYGSLVNINFYAKAAGTSDLNLSNVILVEYPTLGQLPDVFVINGIVDVQEVECQTDDDCNILDDDYCDGDLIKHAEGRCVDYACQVETSTTQDCNALDNDYCDGTEIKRDDYTCDAATCILDSTTTLEDCDNGLYCNGQETCVAAACVAGIPVDCSGNDLPEIATCFNDPDANPFTWDYASAFTSVCDEDADACTVGIYSYTHTCDIEKCGAECAVDEDCDDGIVFTSDSCNSQCECEHVMGARICEYANQASATSQLAGSEASSACGAPDGDGECLLWSGQDKSWSPEYWDEVNQLTLSYPTFVYPTNFTIFGDYNICWKRMWLKNSNTGEEREVFNGNTNDCVFTKLVDEDLLVDTLILETCGWTWSSTDAVQVCGISQP